VNKNRIPTIKILNLNQFEVLKGKYKLTHVVKKYEDYNQIIKLTDLKQTDDIYPIFLTSEVLRRGGDKHMDMYEARPTCDEKLLSVYLGKSKIYTLPFWRCNQHDNMVYTGNLEFDDISLNIYLTNRRLERYLKNKTEKVTDIINLPEIDTKKLNRKIIDEIKRQKIYDIDFNSIMETKIATVLEDILLISPICVKTYEKKYTIPENTYIEEKTIDYDNIFKKRKEEENIKKAINEKVDENKENIDNVSTNMPELLKQNAMNFSFIDDFLIDEDEIDIPILENNLELIEEDEEIYTQPKYYNKELLNIGGFDVKLKDIFVMKPRKTIIKKRRCRLFIEQTKLIAFILSYTTSIQQ